MFFLFVCFFRYSPVSVLSVFLGWGFSVRTIIFPWQFQDTLGMQSWWWFCLMLMHTHICLSARYPVYKSVSLRGHCAVVCMVGLHSEWRGKNLKCLSFWPRDWNICKQESGKSVCIHIFRTIIVPFFPSRIVQSHLVSCCGWIVPAGQSCSATAMHDYSLWPLLPPSTNIGNCTESKYLLCECLTHPDVQSEYGESLQSFNRESHSRPEAPLVGGLVRLPACIHINTTQSSQILILSLLICLLNTSLSMSNISLIGI